MPEIAKAVPLTFAKTVGLLQPAKLPSDGTAVLFLGSFGLEDMCLRAFFRRGAEDLARVGIQSLRFDYPAMGDALDHENGTLDLSQWEEASVDAAGVLRAHSGAKRVVMIGHGLGATLALRIADRIEGLAGVACLAPVVSGRAYLRELQIWSRMVDEGLGLGEAYRNVSEVAIGGHVLPEPLAGQLKRVALSDDRLPSLAHALIASRPGRAGDLELGESLKARGADVSLVPYEDYDAFVANPSQSRLPIALLNSVIEWAVGLSSAVIEGGELYRNPLDTDASLQGDGFVEHPVVFGANLYGIHCLPRTSTDRPSVLLLGTGYDRHAGWGRSTVNLARNLARRGIPSLRFDAAGVADSPARPGAPDQVLYSDFQEHDVREALDFLAQHSAAPIVVVGRCSGAYLAIRSALSDPRINGVVCANPFVFAWDKAIDVDVALKGGARSLDDYGSRLLRWETVERIRRGEVDLRSAARNILKGIMRRLGVAVKPVLARVIPVGVRQRAILAEFAKLEARGVAIELIYSRGDIGYQHFAELFGADGRGLRRFPSAHLTVLEGADHNLSPPFAQAAYQERIVDLCDRIQAASRTQDQA
ncbi:alpha/beta fold hydrolase [Peteryoungia ipomoeae]|uniref:Alpha/beta hydrolase n=1 Tax=Peteryoungia ipomoeae TaxID=1210932 RepID=A0A4S8NYS8_9HYPH|nr:alpha/beta fold hydrolase [Peteryoungia ipomoeae]THV20279.1 alpha/beta hydrolase [Peteryoungia ipomoeae]